MNTPAKPRSEAVQEARRKLAFENMSAAFDAVPAGAVKTRYLICSTERSGSSLLADMLANTGLAGVPMEYFNKLYLEYYFTKVPGADYQIASYFKHLESRRTTANGLFGMKAHLRQILDALGPDSGPKVPEFLKQFDKLIYIERRDKIAQAVSLYRARATGMWTSKHSRFLDDSSGKVRFQGPFLTAGLNDIVQECGDWQKLLAAPGMNVLPLTYEELAADPAGVIRNVLGWLGADASAFQAPSTGLAPQRDQLNDTLKAQFIAYLTGKA